MERLAEFLQTNPVIVILTFVVSVAGAIITIGAQRKQIWRDFLSREVTLPVYVYLILVLAVLFVTMFWPAHDDRTRPLRTIEGEKFGIQRIIVDGKRFVNCEFHRTELVYRGEAGCAIEKCKLDRPQFTFDGPAASTAKTLSSFYKVPQLQPLIDNTFECIKKGQLRTAVTPSPAADD